MTVNGKNLISGNDDSDYEDALTAIGTLISGLKRSNGAAWETHFNSLKNFVKTLQIEDQLRQLKVIHVAGTKGKGSTCCMVESMLRSAGYKTGLFTSPHLCDVRERIRINGRPISKPTFMRNFWHCFLTFERQSTEAAGMPAYFKFLTLLGLKVFIEEHVDVAILEVGLGGRLDATNIVPQPVACGISSLGFDHMEILGHTLKEIATEKAGILKPGSPAFTVKQPEEAKLALEEKAKAVAVNLQIVPELAAYKCSSGQQPVVGLAGSHQEVNAALAIALVGSFEAAQEGDAAQKRATQVAALQLPTEFAHGLQEASWPGRCQVVREISETGACSLEFYLDGAHTPESMEACAKWFCNALSPAANSFLPAAPQRPPRLDTTGGGAPFNQDHGSAKMRMDDLLAASAGGMAQLQGSACAGPVEPTQTQNLLIFNCMQERDPERLLGSLLQNLRRGGVSIDHALFVPPDSLYSKLKRSTESELQRDLSWQLALSETWDRLLGPPATHHRQVQLKLPGFPQLAHQDSRRGAVMPSLRATLAWLRSTAKSHSDLRIRALVTGSLYLVGDMLQHIGQEVR